MIEVRRSSIFDALLNTLRDLTFGPGYRVYYMQRGSLLIVLLSGGDKSSQQADIAMARNVAAKWSE